MLGEIDASGRQCLLLGPGDIDQIYPTTRHHNALREKKRVSSDLTLLDARATATSNIFDALTRGECASEDISHHG